MTQPTLTTINLDRRGVLAGAAALALAAPAAPASAQTVAATGANLRVWTAPEAGAFRNIFAVEGESGFVVLDAPLRKSDGVAAREWLASFRKPVRGVLITHMHPDHNFGLTEMIRGSDVPVVATAAVADAIRAADAGYQKFVPNFIGETETERNRVFPNTLARPGAPVVIDGLSFVAGEIGAAESGADSIWTTSSLPGMAFSGDLVFHRVHSWVANGTTAAYVAALEQLQRQMPAQTVYCPGHGGLTSQIGISRQIDYLQRFRAAVREMARGQASLTDEQKAELVRRMMQIEPSPMLAFGIALGADAVAKELSNG